MSDILDDEWYDYDEHPAEHGRSETDIAFPHHANYCDVFPRRSREVVCELMAFGVPLDNQTHNYLSNRDQYLFVERTKWLLAEGRKKLMDAHLYTARYYKLIPLYGPLDVHNIYAWCERKNDFDYQLTLRNRLSIILHPNAIFERSLNACLLMENADHFLGQIVALLRVLHEHNRLKVRGGREAVDEQYQRDIDCIHAVHSAIQSYVPPTGKEIDQHLTEMHRQLKIPVTSVEQRLSKDMYSNDELRMLILQNYAHVYITDKRQLLMDLLNLVAELSSIDTERSSTGRLITVLSELTRVPSGFYEEDFRDIGNQADNVISAEEVSIYVPGDDRDEDPLLALAENVDSHHLQTKRQRRPHKELRIAPTDDI